MKILILGNSSIFQRKVYLGLKNFKNIKIEIASRRKIIKKKFISKSYNSYNEALNKTEASLVYISLINSEHYKWALESLNKNKHVVIDKPITTKDIETKNLIKVAKKRKLMLSEAIVFQYDLRFKKLSKELNLNKYTKIFCYFHIPKLHKNNFRYIKKYGGGCFNDMSPYATYLINFFFRNKNFAIIKNKKYFVNKLINRFDLSLRSKKVSLETSFSFDNNYKNQIEIHNNSKIFFIDYFFSPPINKKLKIKVYNKLKLHKKIIIFNRQNIFYSYFADIFKLIKKNKFNFFYKEIEDREKIKKKIS